MSDGSDGAFYQGPPTQNLPVSAIMTSVVQLCARKILANAGQQLFSLRRYHVTVILCCYHDWADAGAAPLPAATPARQPSLNLAPEQPLNSTSSVAPLEASIY